MLGVRSGEKMRWKRKRQNGMQCKGRLAQQGRLGGECRGGRGGAGEQLGEGKEGGWVVTGVAAGRNEAPETKRGHLREWVKPRRGATGGKR